MHCVNQHTFSYPDSQKDRHGTWCPSCGKEAHVGAPGCILCIQVHGWQYTPETAGEFLSGCIQYMSRFYHHLIEGLREHQDIPDENIREAVIQADRTRQILLTA